MDLIAGVELLIAKTGWLGATLIGGYLVLLAWLVGSIALGLVRQVRRAQQWQQAKRRIRQSEAAAYREYQPLQRGIGDTNVVPIRRVERGE